MLAPISNFTQIGWKIQKFKFSKFSKHKKDFKNPPNLNYWSLSVLHGLIRSGNIYFTLGISFVQGHKWPRMVLNFPKCLQAKMENPRIFSGLIGWMFRVYGFFCSRCWSLSNNLSLPLFDWPTAGEFLFTFSYKDICYLPRGLGPIVYWGLQIHNDVFTYCLYFWEIPAKRRMIGFWWW